MTRTETDDKQMENLQDQLVVLWLHQEFDDYNMLYFNQYFSKHFRPSVSENAYRKDLQYKKTMLLSRKHSQVVSTMMLTSMQIPSAIMNYRKVIISVCISLLLKENNVMNVKFIY